MKGEEPAILGTSADGSAIVNQKKCPCFLGCCNRFRFKTDDATGFAMNACGSGPVVMSNAFLAASLIALAKMEIGCEPDEDCDGKVYGFKPSSLITIIATISGILSCLLLPLLGAIVDYTRFRHKVVSAECQLS